MDSEVDSNQNIHAYTAESNSVIHKDNTIGREGDNGNFGIDIAYLMWQKEAPMLKSFLGIETLLIAHNANVMPVQL